MALTNQTQWKKLSPSHAENSHSSISTACLLYSSMYNMDTTLHSSHNSKYVNSTESACRTRIKSQPVGTQANITDNDNICQLSFAPLSVSCDIFSYYGLYPLCGNEDMCEVRRMLLHAWLSHWHSSFTLLCSMS